MIDESLGLAGGDTRLGGLDTKETIRKIYTGFRKQMHQKVIENTVDEVDDLSPSVQDGWNGKRAAKHRAIKNKKITLSLR